MLLSREIPGIKQMITYSLDKLLRHSDEFGDNHLPVVHQIAGVKRLRAPSASDPF